MTGLAPLSGDLLAQIAPPEHDDRTGRGYPAPHPDNMLDADAVRGRAAIDMIDADVTAALQAAQTASGIVGATSGDAAPGALADKLASGANITLTPVVVGGVEKIRIDAADGGSQVSQSAPTYVVSGGAATITGQSVLSVYEQIAGQAFNLTYNARADYTEQDSVNGTDSVSGTFVLHNTAGAVIDSNTKLLIHADGTNGDTAIIDERGITPFGTHCAYFDGSSYFKVPSSYKIAWGTSQNFTMEGWVRSASVGTLQRVFDCREGGSSNLGFYVNTNGKFAVTVNGANTDSSQTASADTWYHWVLVRNSGTLTLYIDGTSVYSAANGTNFTASSIWIGIDNGGSEYFKGWMDEFRVSNTARYTANFTRPTAAFVRDSSTVYLFHFDDGHGSQFIRDDSRSGHEVMLSGASLSTTRSKFGSSSLSLNGSSGWCQIGTSKAPEDLKLGPHDFTVDGWFYPTAWPTGGNDAVLFNFGQSSQPTFVVRVDSIGRATAYISTNGSTWDVASAVVFGTLTLNAWNHVAITRSGTSIYGFVGGTLGATMTIGAGAVPYNGTGLIGIGRNTSAASYHFTGNADEFRFKKAECLWTASFTPPSSPAVADDRTVVLLHFDGANNDQVTLDSSESSYGNDNYADSFIPILGFQNSAALSSAQSRGGNGTSLDCSSGGKQAAIVYAQPSAGHPLYFAPWEQFCVEGWFYLPSDRNNAPMCFYMGSENNGTNEIYMQAGTSNVSMTYPGGSSTSSVSPVTGWNHLAFVREGRGYVVYVNGVGSTPNNPHVNFTYAADGRLLSLGRYRTTGGPHDLTGYIDSFRITHGSPRYTANFTPANLTQDDATTLLWVFSGSVGQKWVKELSKNAALIQATNARTVKGGTWLLPVVVSNNLPKVTTSTQKFGTGSLSFGGNGEYIKTPSIVAAGDLTLDFWVNVASIPAEGTTHVILQQGSASADYGLYAAFYTSTFLKIRLAYYYGTAGNWHYHDVTVSSWSTNQWHHVAMVRSGSTLYVYVDGVYQASVGAANVMNQSAGPIYIGGYPGQTSPFFSGRIDELRVSNTARWTGTSNFTVPSIPYGQQYVTGPCYVTTAAASQIDVSAFSSIEAVTVGETLNPGTSIKYLASFDGRATWQRWNGSAWVATMLANIDSVGNTSADIKTGLLAWSPALGVTIDIAASLKTTNQNFTPVLDSVTVTMDEYVKMADVDYSVKRKKASGVQAITFTRIKAGNANHVFDYIA